MLQRSGESFLSEFRGCFSGAVYVKPEDKWISIPNQVGDNPVFYLNTSGKFAAASQVNYLWDSAKSRELTLPLMSPALSDVDIRYIALTNLCHEIKRLHGGDYLGVSNGKLEVKTYHRFEKIQSALKARLKHNH
jgi:asparagine synthetase B (glutamine-hydrolysing)